MDFKLSPKQIELLAQVRGTGLVISPYGPSKSAGFFASARVLEGYGLVWISGNQVRLPLSGPIQFNWRSFKNRANGFGQRRQDLIEDIALFRAADDAFVRDHFVIVHVKDKG